MCCPPKMVWLVMVILVTVSTMLVVFTHSQNTEQQEDDVTLKTVNLPHEICGQSEIFDEKIIHGDNVTLGAYPWMAAIGYTLGSRGLYWNCGGSLVTDQFVVTAAHCVDPKRIQRKYPFVLSVVRLADLNLDDSVDDGTVPVDVEVEKSTFHPEYDGDYKINDIGLIKLKAKVQFSRLIKPICLPSQEFYKNTFVDYSVLVIGWGNTKNGSTTVLSEISVDIHDNDVCKVNITRGLPYSILDERVLCASSPEKDSCLGDSGGPMMLLHRYNWKAKIYLLGVVSYGYGCAKEGYPGVYTRVDRFMDWITENLQL